MKMSYQGHLGTRPCTSGEPWDLDSKPWTYRRLPTKRHGRAKPFAASCTCQPSLNKSVCSCNPPSMTEAQSGAARSWCAKSKGAINELQQTGNTKHQRQKKVRRRRRTTTTHHHHHHHHLHITFCPYSNHRDHRELRLKTIQPNMAFEPWMTSSVAWSFCPSSAWHGVAGSYVISNWIQWHPHRDQAIASPPTGRISKWICFNGFLHGFVAGIFHGCFLYQFV